MVYLPQKHRIAEVFYSAFQRFCGKNNKHKKRGKPAEKNDDFV
jgi:hypothetical protein